MCPALRPLPQPPVSPEKPHADRVAGPMAQSQGGTTGAVSSPVSGKGPLCDWMETQASVLGFWLDRLIEQGDPDDLISLVHRQQAWLAMMRARVGQG